LICRWRAGTKRNWGMSEKQRPYWRRIVHFPTRETPESVVLASLSSYNAGFPNASSSKDTPIGFREKSFVRFVRIFPHSPFTSQHRSWRRYAVVVMSATRPRLDEDRGELTGQSSAASLPTGPVMAEPFISPLGLTICNSTSQPMPFPMIVVPQQGHEVSTSSSASLCLLLPLHHAQE
jgi:hypothetical protein